MIQDHLAQKVIFCLISAATALGICGCGKSTSSSSTNYVLETEGEVGASIYLIDPSQFESIPSGQSVIVVMGSGQGAPPSGATDTLGNTFSLMKSVTNGSFYASLYMAPYAGSGSDTVTVSWGGGATNQWTSAAIVAGLQSSSTDDGIVSNDGTSGTTVSCASLTTTHSNDVLLAMAALETQQPTWTIPSPWTLLIPSISTSGFETAIASDTTTSTGTYSPTFTTTISDAWICFTLALPLQ